MKYRNCKIFIFIFILFIGCTINPDGFIIQGEVSGFKDSTVLYLYNPKIQESIDSSLIIEGKFKFEGKLEEPQRLFVTNKYVNEEEYKYTSFFVENSLIKVKGEYNNFRYCNVTGSKSQEIEKKLVKEIKENNIIRDSLIRYINKNRTSITDDEKNVLWWKINKTDSLNDIQYLKFIDENLNSYPALEKLQWRMSEISKDSVRMYFDRLTPKFKEASTGELINTYLNSRVIKIGGPYIDFEAITLNGEKFKLSDVKKDFILLDFWSSGCGPCRTANKELAKRYDEIEKNLEIVSFSLDVKKERIENASIEDGIKWTNVTDFKGNNSGIAVQYEISVIPCSYLIDKKRNVIKKYIGYNPNYIDEIKNIVLAK
ncbi:DUF4369 domain-containing protein [Bacteroidota bacterium]